MWDWMNQLEALRQEGAPFAVLTVVVADGSTPREVGAKMLLARDGRAWGTVGGGQLEQLAVADALECLRQGQARTFRYPLGARAGQCCGGRMDILVEPLLAGPRLYLFGAGHVGQALCQVLSGTPFSVDLVDEREQWLSAPALPSDVRRHDAGHEHFLTSATWDAERTYVVIMTHQHELDFNILREVLSRPTRYVGLIGSEAKWRRFEGRLRERGFAPEGLARVHCPLGLPIGGKTPKEVAISVAADLLRRHHDSHTAALPPKGPPDAP